jgi:iron complex outermembrane receptor protein
MTKGHTFACCLCTSATIVAFAYSSDAAAQTVESSIGLEEVVVSATRRGETNLQETPIAVTALSAETLRALVPRDISDASAFVPNFSASRITAFNAASFSIRGAGQTDIIVYLEPPVAVTVDDFVVSSVQTQLLDTFDIEQMEVLRGPQGTLFGKNTTGGVVTIRTKRPELDAFGAELQLGAGSFGRQEAKAAVDLPVVDGRFALRLVGSYRETDGYYKLGAAYGPTVAAIPEFVGLSGQGNRDDAGGEDVVSGRIKALWQVTDNFSALAQFEILRDRSDAVPSVNDTPGEPGCIPFGDPSAGGCTFVWNSLGLTRDAGDPIDVAASTNRAGAGLNMDRGQRIDVDGAYLNLDWTFGDGLTLNSVTGYREQESRLPNTYTGEVGPVSLFDATRDDNRETFQQEVRLSGSLDRLNWVIGGFYQQEDVEFCVLQVLGFLDMLGLGQQFFGVPDFFNNNPQILCNAQEADVYAGFVDGTYEVTDRFSVTAGLRYTNEKKEWTGRNQVFIQALNGGFDPTFTFAELGEPLNAANFGRFPTGVVRDEEEWSEPSWRLIGQYLFTDDVNGYLSYSRGFKSGGYNDQTGTTGNPISAASARPYDPEFATSYEVGLKSELLDRRLRLNLAAFYVEYEDAQRALVATVTNEFGQTFQETRFFNAADVEAKGFELEGTAAITDTFTLLFNAGYLDAEYKSFEADTDFDGVIDVNFTGLPVARAPEFSGSVGFTWDFALGSVGSLQLGANYYHEDESLFILSDLGEQFNGTLDQKDIVNASLTYRSPDENWFVRAYGKNLTDDRYRIAVQPVANLWTHAQFGEPRSWGLEFGVNFGGN